MNIAVKKQGMNPEMKFSYIIYISCVVGISLHLQFTIVKDIISCFK